MIAVDRSRVALPQSWLERASTEAEQAAAAYARASRAAFTFRVYRMPETQQLLRELFSSKCAFCESLLPPTGQVIVDLFRPKAMIVELDGSTYKPGYWWLATEWSNLYPACVDCNRIKGNRFPIAGPRAMRPDGEALRNERCLALDPCADDPDGYLLFGLNGSVASRSADPDVRAKLDGKRYRSLDRGQITIDLFGLNRTGLTRARREAIAALRARFEQELRGRGEERARWSTSEDLTESLAHLIARNEPYVAAQRQSLRLMALEWLSAAADRPAAKQRLEQIGQRRDRLFDYQRTHERRLRHASIEQNPDLESRRSLKIDRIEISNFRAIDDLDFHFGRGTQERSGWKMLLGENGVGKSSVLQAVALLMMGSEHAQAIEEVDPTQLLRRGTRSGHVRITLAADAEPRELRLTRRGFEYSTAGAGLLTVMLGFGSSRWLPRPGGFEPDRGDFIRVHNLFNPFVPLTDTLAWLAGLDAGEFRKVEGPLLRLLSFDSGERLRRREGRVLVQGPGEPISKATPLEQLSDGYQSVLAMVGDIMELLGTKRLDMEAAEGLVLIDEIGAHLHPSWRLSVVSQLRAAFPNLQFLVSTHDPLCLHGVNDDEVLVLRKDTQGRTVALEDLPSVEGLRVDQLLTSPHFGLLSTIDEKVERRFEEYYDLLAQSRRTKDEQQRLEQLKADLGEQLIGGNRRDQLMYEAIDEQLARESDALREGGQELLKDRTRARLREILERVHPE